MESGIRCLEVTAPTPGADDVIAELARLGDVEVGMGTVLNRRDVDRAAEVGAEFVVCPHTDPVVISAARDRGMEAFPGALTPSEVVAASNAGASAVKLFPANLVGPSFLSALVDGPMPGLKAVPTGGIRLHDIDRWREAGAWAVAAGDPLIGDALDGGPMDELRVRARAFAEVAGQVDDDAEGW